MEKKAFGVKELIQFFSMLIIMGTIHYPRLDEYWCTHWTFGTNAFSRVITRDRFTCLLKFFHLNDNKEMKKKDHPN